MKVKVVNNSINPLPKYQTLGAAGLDVHSDEYVIIDSGEMLLVKTGLQIEIPEGYEVQIRPRSSLALNYGVTVLNSPATIDSDYRGTIGVILINHGKKPLVIHPGDRIAQFILVKVEQIEWEAVDFLSLSDRGLGGFGSTGI